MVFAAILSIFSSVFFFFWDNFLYWLSIFAAPIKEPEMFWVIVPIWINWFLTEFYQEKYGTSFGNAVGNGAIAIFASVDWTRYIYRLYADGQIDLTFGVFLKFLMAMAVFVYGAFVIIAGIKIKRIVFFIGRVRWVTYILLMFTPIVYNVVRMDLRTLSVILVFFPLYYWTIEFFDRITPEPKIYREG